jgi:hypothetical protein
MTHEKCWKPRWYYIKRNKTSGKLYFGQTTNTDVSLYFGSGRYWKNHCKTHGGRTVLNIETLYAEWFTEEHKAQEFIDFMEIWCPEYPFGGPGKRWANIVRENTNDSPFTGNGDLMKQWWNAERRNNISNIRQGNKHAVGAVRTQESRDRRRKTMTGVKHSQERIETNRLSKLGKKVYNNGVKAHYFVPGQEPFGFVKGRLEK